MKTPLKVHVIEFFIGNTRNKLTSLLFAVVVWAFAFGNTGHEENVEGFILVQPQGKDQVVVKQEIAQSRLVGQTGDPFTGRCRISISGPRNVLTRYLDSTERLNGTIQIEGSGRVDLIGGNVFDLPSGLSIKAIDPSWLNVIVDQVVKVEIEVKPLISGTPGQGFVLFPGGITTEPRSVFLEGPRELLEGDSIGVFTQEIDIAGSATEKLEQTVALVITGDDTGLVSIASGSPSEVVVRLEFQPNLTQAQAEVSVRYIVDEEIDLDIRGDRTIKVSVSGIEDAVREWEKRVQQGTFYLLVKVTDTEGQNRNVPTEEVRWIEGSLPDGISRDQVKLERIILYSAQLLKAVREDEQQ
ncbi:MAG TPA: hypothetical protein EYO84_02575 [Planctomycetes bacterium]|nr:hypothetical protein [Planctomycetota bacterium]